MQLIWQLLKQRLKNKTYSKANDILDKLSKNTKEWEDNDFKLGIGRRSEAGKIDSDVVTTM